MNISDAATVQQDLPSGGIGPEIATLVSHDARWMVPRHLVQPLQDAIAARRELGIAKYGRPLRAFDGRDTTIDQFQEAIDLAKYLRKGLIEQVKNPPENYAEALAYYDMVLRLCGWLCAQVEKESAP